MINFRYHVISLTAVFLALALGITMGSTFLNKPFVTGLESQVDIAERKVKDRNTEIDRLRAELERATDEDAALFSGALVDVASRALKGQPVALFTVAGTDEAVIDQLVGLLSAAGAKVPAVIRATDRMNLDDAKQTEAIARALGVKAATDADRRSVVLDSVASALAGAAAEPADKQTTTTAAASSISTIPTTAATTPTTVAISTSTAPTSPTTAASSTTTTSATDEAVDNSKVLSTLDDDGFLEIETPDDPPATFATLPENTNVIFVVGEGQELDAQQLLLPVAEAVAVDHADDFIIASALKPASRVEDATDERVALRNAIVAPFRSSAALDGKVTTVDNADSPAGQAAVLLAIGSKQAGDYGIADGATAVLPGQD